MDHATGYVVEGSHRSLAPPGLLPSRMLMYLRR